MKIKKSVKLSLFLGVTALTSALCFSISSFGDYETASSKLTNSGFTESVAAEYKKEKELIPSGQPFGIKMFTKGVMVVGLSDIEKEGDLFNPAKESGIRCGDIILSIDGKEVTSNEDVGKVIDASCGKEVTITLKSHGKIRAVPLKPIKSGSKFKAGMWVRDSSAGIGTMTFIDPETGSFGGLGHAVCDIDTGKLMPIDRGKAVEVKITGINKGKEGSPGELRGSFKSGLPIGNLENNRESGIFGKIRRDKIAGKALKTASREEIKEGRAYILTTLSGSSPKAYQISIERVMRNSKNKSKNMIIKITDPELLEKTGGIVQGMSGSPIIQDGRLVGAVTHVLVNDPTRGYGIFIENML